MESIMNGTYQPEDKNNTGQNSMKSSTNNTNVDKPRQVKFHNQHLGPSGENNERSADDTTSICFEHTDSSTSNNVIYIYFLLRSCLWFLHV